ncbi:hypothetical protein OROHE_025973 [Orobanche hederae]
MKVVACFLMLHYPTHCRVRVVLQRMELEMKKNLKIGESVSVKDVDVDGDGDGEDKMCPICWDNYSPPDKLTRLRRCKHYMKNVWNNGCKPNVTISVLCATIM